MKDYYQILGIERNASKDDIKKSFHKLAHKYHPDKKGGDEAKFKEINEAYQTLSDDAKRTQYDRFGRGWSGARAGGGQANWGGFDFSNFAQEGGEGFDFGDIFSDLFGGAQGREQTRRGRDISVDIQIPFTEAVFGTERKILIAKVGTCDDCHGSGAAAGTALKKCAACGGKGQVHEVKRSVFGSISLVKVCTVCHGRGEAPEKKCAACGGAGVLKKSEEVHIHIPAGIEGGEMIRLSGQGEAVPGGLAGDLYVKVHVERHPIFRRDGANLLMDLQIKLTDALLGAEYKINTLDGGLTLKIPVGISYGEILRIRGKGVPTRGGKRGDLFVTVKFRIPAKLSKKEKDLVEKLKEEGM